MRIIYLGAEVPSNRTLLETTSATSVGVSFWRLVKRGLPKKSAYLLENYFSDDYSIHAYAGIPKGTQLSADELDEFAAQYEEFIANNLDRVTTFSEISGVDPKFVDEQRKTAWSMVAPGKFQPIWDPELGIKYLNQMADTYLDIGIPGYAVEEDPQLAVVTRTLNRLQGTRFHLLGVAKPDNLRQLTIETTSTLSWLSPMMHGETIVWDGTKLMRYPKRMKTQARARYRNVYTKAGLDIDKILEDDPQEVCRLAVWSYIQLERKANGMTSNDDPFLYDNSDDSIMDVTAETPPAIPDNKGVSMRKLIAREDHEMGNLPVFGYDIKPVVEDDGTIKDIQTVESQSASLRTCNSCYVATNCPAFKPDAVCAFKLPIEVKTKDQLKALINAVIEMQGQRVAFMRFAEELSGGYADPNVSQEIDRLFKLIKTTKELDDSREFIRMTVERQGSSGVLSSIFGDRAQVTNELPNGGLTEVETTRIIKEAIED
ncbi:hypothetical protein UFOVP965_87 [uncultured Caudovirales phage]|uniref:Uncharacterized protein n=1 Tax=uncultured Caudovirales phage TaxID=2100421 RepID=A0A6J5PT31_9CAUD|nr:hypothetical protein UFOVP965_87 [uncultured Caudovirales phage]CAB4179855.1 hypothetical protein UFOVP1035_83 [uncultured Caudovirales phage]CAB4188629.1 hypothetical protein UFOVP1181_42 [uncultured Caudovirales phage]